MAFGAREPRLPGGEGVLALEAVTLFFLANGLADGFVEWGEEVEGDVGGLEALGVAMSDVVGEGAVCGSAWGGFRDAALG